MVFSLIRLAIYQVSSVIVEVLRGLPLATVLVVMAFVLIPQIVNAIEAANNIEISWRGGSVETAIVCLALVYGSFMSETFRAGIQSVEKGQLEAARALGLGYPKMMRYIVLPQAIRRILPPLGNDFVSMIKDSALVSLIGLRDITQVAKIDSGSTFQYLPTYLTVAVLYMSLTIVGSLGVKYIERRFKSSVR
jgi:polar amino acid transport system permease protein